MTGKENLTIPIAEKTADGKYVYLFVAKDNSRHAGSLIVLSLLIFSLLYTFGRPLYTNWGSSASDSATMTLQVVMVASAFLLLLQSLKILFRHKEKPYTSVVKDKRIVTVQKFTAFLKDLIPPRREYHILDSSGKGWLIVGRDIWHSLNVGDTIEVQLEPYALIYSEKPTFGIYWLKPNWYFVSTLVVMTMTPLVAKTASEIEAIESAQQKTVLYTR